MGSEYVGLAFVTEPDGDETEVRAALRVEPDGWWGGYLIGTADWIGIASTTEPFFELRLPDGRSGAAFVSDFDTAATNERVTIYGIDRVNARLEADLATTLGSPGPHSMTCSVTNVLMSLTKASLTWAFAPSQT